MSYNFYRAIILGFLLAGCTKIEQNNLNFEDLKNRLISANDGDTVKIPEGTCFFPDGIVIDKSITILGAGADKTVFKALTGKKAGFLLKSMKANNVRISGITFHMNNVLNCGGVYIYDEHHNFRVDHCKFTDAAYAKIGGTYDGRPLKIEGYTDGVIDHCRFLNNRFTDIAVLGDLQKFDDAGISWSRPVILGDNNGVVFIEDCSFDYEQLWMIQNCPATSCIASNDGSRYVFRYNTINAGYYRNGDTIHWVESTIDAHGNYISGHRGSVSVEVYNNTINSVYSCYGMHIRGGTGVIYNNLFTGKFNFPILLTNYRSFSPPLSDEPASVCTHFTPGVSECIDVDHGRDQVNNLFIWNNLYTRNGEATVTASATVDNRGHVKEHIIENIAFFNEKQPDGILKSPWTSYTHAAYSAYTYPHSLVK